MGVGTGVVRLGVPVLLGGWLRFGVGRSPRRRPEGTTFPGGAAELGRVVGSGLRRPLPKMWLATPADGENDQPSNTCVETGRL